MCNVLLLLPTKRTGGAASSVDGLDMVLCPCCSGTDIAEDGSVLRVLGREGSMEDLVVKLLRALGVVAVAVGGGVSGTLGNGCGKGAYVLPWCCG